jgi:hypothetical protein
MGADEETAERNWLADIREVLADAYHPEGIEVWLDSTKGGGNITLPNRQLVANGHGASVLVWAERTIGRTLDEIRASSVVEPAREDGEPCPCGLYAHVPSDGEGGRPPIGPSYVTVTVDRVPYGLTPARRDGSTLRETFGLPKSANVDLYLETPEPAEDLHVDWATQVDVVEGLRFFTVPRHIGAPAPARVGEGGDAAARAAMADVLHVIGIARGESAPMHLLGSPVERKAWEDGFDAALNTITDNLPASGEGE